MIRLYDLKQCNTYLHTPVTVVRDWPIFAPDRLLGQDYYDLYPYSYTFHFDLALFLHSCCVLLLGFFPCFFCKLFHDGLVFSHLFLMRSAQTMVHCRPGQGDHNVLKSPTNIRNTVNLHVLQSIPKTIRDSIELTDNSPMNSEPLGCSLESLAKYSFEFIQIIWLSA